VPQEHKQISTKAKTAVAIHSVYSHREGNVVEEW